MRARAPASRKPGADGPSAISVIVPTYNETGNVRPLCERLTKALKEADIEADILLVDDESPGSDETASIVKELAGAGHPVRIHCRKKSEGKGLSSAVLLGFKMAVHATLVCMDADLQHEPESVPAIAKPVLEGKAEFVVGSRNVSGGGVGFEWSILRRIISWGATMLAWPVAASTDPMSGFFCTSREVLKRSEERLNPVGFKIGLEIMARCRCKPVVDVAITFQDRNSGESKLDNKQMVLYLQQLSGLYWDKFGMLLVLLFVLAIFFLLYLMQLALKMLA